MASQKILRIVISGTVQGVGYRAFLAEHARELGVEGWTRNLSDGRVEAVLAGRAEDVGEVLIACRRGPPGAAVEGIDTYEAGPQALAEARPGGFTILPSR